MINKKIKSCLAILISFVNVLMIFLPISSIKSSAYNYKDNSRVIVSLGDSYSAGEGLHDYYGEDSPENKRMYNQDFLSHRSENSWPGQLLCNSSTVAKTQKDKNWFFAAMSGATTYNIIGKDEIPVKYEGDDYPLNNKDEYISGEWQQKKYMELYPLSASGLVLVPIDNGEEGVTIDLQIDVFDDETLKDKEVDYVTMTIGGNDIGFAEIASDIVTCPIFLSPNDFRKKLDTVKKYFMGINGKVTLDNVSQAVLGKNLRAVYEAVAIKAGSNAKIIIAGYPKLLEPNGKGVLVSKTEAEEVNNAITFFNKFISKVIDEYNKEHNEEKLHFVSVESDFENHAIYSKEPWLYNYEWIRKNDDINGKLGFFISAASFHPNKDGAEVYRKCVQDKIDELESSKQSSQQETTTSPPITTSSERDVVLVLDTSGSMSGEPLEQTKRAAEKFVDTVLAESANVAIVNYDDSANMASSFTNNATELKRIINELYDGGGTNIESGLRLAEQMLTQSKAEKKIIVLMSDGEPNAGLVGEELISYSNTLKENGTYIYTLGFFESMGDEKSDAQLLMEGIASEGCHYEVSDAESLVFFFGDIADQINGQKYIYVRIACPVDVSVEYNGETLDSSERNLNTRTDFGTLTFEDSNEETIDNSGYDYSYDSNYDTQNDKVKILRLKEGEDYNIKIVGTGRGRMDYSIGFMDENGEYSDFRKFKNVSITRKTEIDTVAMVSEKTVLNVDEDGDGRYDITYEAGKNENGQIVDYSYIIYILVGLVGFLILLILILVISQKIKKNKQRKFYR